jgi:GH15 family glucan-1,4-alpha-glucosidase
LAEHLIAIAETPADLDRPRAYLEWCARRALPSGIFSEQVHPYTGEPLSVSPLTWSHAAFVSAVQRYARRSRLIKDRLRDQVKTAGEVIV